MQTTIYIRKENEDYWKSLADRSLQVNHWIIVARESSNTIQESINKTNNVTQHNVTQEITPKVIKTKEEALEAIKPIATFKDKGLTETQDVTPKPRIEPITYKNTNNWGA